MVRHEVLGIRPKHRFVLQNPGSKHTQQECGKEKTDKRKGG